MAVIVATLAVAASGRFLATGALVIGNIVVHVLKSFGPAFLVERGGQTFQVPVVQWDLSLHGDWLAAAQPQAFLQLLTHMFVHADIWHLVGNLIILLAFALPFEERIGHRAFLGMYLLSGFVAAFAQVGTSWGSPTLLLGASGAVFGIIGAFAGAYPNLVLPLPLPLFFIMIFVRMRVIVAAAVFGGLQILYLVFLSPFDNTAYFAHLGGLVAGLVLAGTYVRRHRKDVGREVQSKLDLGNLGPFAQDAATRNAHRKLYDSLDQPEVFEAWMERFLESARCPTCHSPVALRRSDMVCTHGHRFDMREGASGPQTSPLRS